MDGKRQLPVWMRGVQSKTTPSMDADVGVEGKDHDQGVIRVSSKTRVKRKGWDVETLVKCDGGKGKKRSHECDADVEIRREKRKRLLKGSNKGKEEGRSRKNGEEAEDFLSDDADADLTMEDLMDFAKEYTKKDDDEQTSRGDIDAKSRVRETAELSTAREAWKIHEDEEAIRVCGTTKPEECFAASRDSTQEMLDLFLGPLLKKTREEEKKTKSTTFAYELEKQKQNLSLVPREEPRPLVLKKKSSLKDKVALFVD